MEAQTLDRRSPILYAVLGRKGRMKRPPGGNGHIAPWFPMGVE